MTIATKVTAATLGAGVVSLVGCYVGGVFNGGIEWYAINKTSYEDNTIGKGYWRYLTGVGENNKIWWERFFEQYKEDKSKSENADKLSTHFSTNKTITSAYDATAATALNKVCEEAYRKNTTSEVSFESGTEDKHKLAANILKYCSPLGKIPSIVKNSTDEEKISKKGQEKKLVNATESENDGFWLAQNEWFKQQGKTTPQPDIYFNQFFEDSSRALKREWDIKTICAEAYTKEEMTTGDATKQKPKIDDVAKYCSFQKLTA